MQDQTPDPKAVLKDRLESGLAVVASTTLQGFRFTYNHRDVSARVVTAGEVVVGVETFRGPHSSLVFSAGTFSLEDPNLVEGVRTGLDKLYPAPLRLPGEDLADLELGTTDDTAISPREPALRHRWCYGHFSRIRVTEGQQVLVCKHCFLRVLVPFGLKTMGDLRRCAKEKG